MLRRKLLCVAALLGLGVVSSVSAQGDPAPAKDQHGDPLPKGAIARFGTTRWRHGGSVGYVAFLPDGKHVISVGDDRAIRVWEFPSGKEIRRFGLEELDEASMTINGQRVIYYRPNGLPASLTKDGKHIACDLDGALRVYEVETGKELPPVKRNNKFGGNFAGALEFSPDGKELATLDYDGTVRVYDWVNNKEIRSFGGPGGNGAIFGGNPVLTYAPDGKSLATVSLELVNNMVAYSVKVWDPSNGQMSRSIALGQNVGAMGAVFSPDSKQLAVTGFDASVTVFDAATGKELCRVQDQRSGQITASYGKDSKTFFTRGQGLLIREWDSATGKEIRQLGDKEGRMVFNRFGFGFAGGSRMAISPDGATLAVPSQDHAVRFVDLASGKEVAPPAGGHTGSVLSVDFTADGKRLWTQGADGTIRQWDTVNGKELEPLKLPSTAYFANVSPDGKYALMQPLGPSTLPLIETATGKEIGKIEGPPNEFGAKVVFSPDGKAVAIRWQQSRKVEIFEVPSLRSRKVVGINTGMPEPGQPFGPNQRIALPTLLFSADGKLLGGYSDPNTFSVWEASSGRVLTQITTPMPSAIYGGAFSLDGRCLAADMGDGTVHLYELATGGKRRSYGAKPPAPKNNNMMGGNFAVVGYNGFNDGPSSKVTFSPDGKKLVHAGLDRLIHVWDVETGKELAALKGHSGAVNTVAFAPNGKQLASASNDTTALLWDVSALSAPAVAEKPLPADQVEARWAALLGGEADKAFAAICELSASPKEAVLLLGKHLQPAPPIDMKEVQKLIDELGSDVYKVRQKANAELLKMGERAVPAIDKALAKQPALETKTRLEQVRAKLTAVVLTDDKLRTYRAVEVLERIGTPEARQVLQTLADGAPGAFSTTTAQAALDRLKKQ
jgi:WD40 repeat protein